MRFGKRPKTLDKRILALVEDAIPGVVEVGELRPELLLRRDLQLDSLALVGAIFSFESEFDICLDTLDIDLSGLETVGDVLAKGREILAWAGVT